MGLFGTRDSRAAARQSRQANRAARQAVRQAARTARASGRQSVRATAYENGFDPNASWAGVANNAVSTVGKFAGAGRVPGPGATGPGLIPGESTNGGNFGTLAIGALALFMIMK